MAPLSVQRCKVDRKRGRLVVSLVHLVLLEVQHLHSHTRDDQVVSPVWSRALSHLILMVSTTASWNAVPISLSCSFRLLIDFKVLRVNVFKPLKLKFRPGCWSSDEVKSFRLPRDFCDRGPPG